MTFKVLNIAYATGPDISIFCDFKRHLLETFKLNSSENSAKDTSKWTFQIYNLVQTTSNSFKYTQNKAGAWSYS